MAIKIMSNFSGIHYYILYYVPDHISIVGILLKMLERTEDFERLLFKAFFKSLCT